ncbi:hypothetical protein JCM6882_003549 [Rhodosporidiobolus microsporus]
MLPILICNPNCTKAMTDGLKPLLESFIASSALPPPTFFTAPDGIPSINNDKDCHDSADIVFPYLTSPTSDDKPSESLLSTHSAVLIACYSVHPLVPRLKALTSKPVIGILEASVVASLSLLAGSPEGKFGIVTTGAVWDDILSTGVRDFLGAAESARFAGVATTGWNAVELHDAPAGEVKRRLKEATVRLIRKANEGGKGTLSAVCLGCAGMAGMDKTVREACMEELGGEKGGKVHIVDGVKAGYALLEGMVRGSC